MRTLGMRAMSQEDVMHVLRAGGAGESPVPDELASQLYEELRALAAAHFRAESGAHTLQPTALVHDVYLRIASNPQLRIGDKAHFLCLASKLMRHILVDHARRKAAQKRGSRWERVTLSGVDSDVPDSLVDALDLDDALKKLAEQNPRAAELVELRFYGGLTMEEAAESLGTSLETAKRDWRLAKAWIARELRMESPQ